MKRETRARTRGLATYKIPEGFEVSVDELPRTTKNTVKRYLFAKQ